MRTFIATALLSLVMVSSCKVMQSYYLKGNYQEGPVTLYSHLSKSEIFSRITSALEKEGITKFKILSPETGVIMTEEFELNERISREDAAGKLINPGAAVVIGNFRTISAKELNPTSTKGVITVRLLEDNGSQKVWIMMTSLKSIYKYQEGTEIERVTEIPSKSTGKIEKALSESLK